MRMGVGSKSHICETCNLPNADCIGHFGHMNLCLPVYHIGFFKHLINVLKCICKNCGHVMLPHEEKLSLLKKCKAIRFNYLMRANQMKKTIKECNKLKYCSDCGHANPFVRKVPKIAGKI